MKILGVLLMACLLVGCGPSKREVELESQLDELKTDLQQLSDEVESKEKARVAAEQKAKVAKAAEEVAIERKNIAEVKYATLVKAAEQTKAAEEAKATAAEEQKQKELEKDRKDRLEKIVSDFNSLRIGQVASEGYFKYKMRLSNDPDYPITVWAYSKYLNNKTTIVSEERFDPKTINTYFNTSQKGNALILRAKSMHRSEYLAEGDKDLFAYYYIDYGIGGLKGVMDFKKIDKEWKVKTTKEEFEKIKEGRSKHPTEYGKLGYQQIKSLSYEDFCRKLISGRKSFFTRWEWRALSYGIQIRFTVSEDQKGPLIKLFTDLAELYNE